MKCLSPSEIVRDTAGFIVRIRCGVCLGCRRTRREAWAGRILAETSLAGSAIFLTLTYAEPNLPQGLEASDMQRFFKRLRKNSGQSFRYFCIGEYGSRTSRPHWHMMIWNICPAFSVLGKGPVFLKSWRFGWSYVGEVNARTARYVAKYVLKEEGRDGCKVLSSRQPAIGAAWFHQIGVRIAQEVQKSGQVIELPLVFSSGGQRFPIDAVSRKSMVEGYETVLEYKESSRIATDLYSRVERLAKLELDDVPLAEGEYRASWMSEQTRRTSLELSAEKKASAAASRAKFENYYFEDGTPVPKKGHLQDRRGNPIPV